MKKIIIEATVGEYYNQEDQYVSVKAETQQGKKTFNIRPLLGVMEVPNTKGKQVAVTIASVDENHGNWTMLAQYELYMEVHYDIVTIYTVRKGYSEVLKAYTDREEALRALYSCAVMQYESACFVDADVNTVRQ